MHRGWLFFVGTDVCHWILKQSQHSSRSGRLPFKCASPLDVRDHLIFSEMSRLEYCYVYDQFILQDFIFLHTANPVKLLKLSLREN